VDIWCDPEWTNERHIGASSHAHLMRAEQRKGAAEILIGFGKRGITRNGGNAQHLQLWSRQRNRECHGVIVPWVAINDDR
jgi:hypothetical protein